MTSTREIPREEGSMPPRPDPGTFADIGTYLDSLTTETQAYVEAERAYLGLMLAKRAAELGSSLVGIFVGALIVAGAVLFASIAGAIALGQAVGDPAMGFVLMAGIYAVLLAIFYLLWKSGVGDRFKLNILNRFHGH